MKVKSVVFVLSIILASKVLAQQILNGSFEDTLHVSNTILPQDSLRPMYWGFSWFTLGCGGVMGDMTTDSHSGNWAVRLETIDCEGPIVPATISNRSELPDSVHFVQSSSQILYARPDQFKFYYKYTPVEGDTASFSAVLFNYPDSITLNNPLWYTYFDTIGIAQGKIIESSSSYSLYLLNFEYSSEEVPKYLSVYFTSNHILEESLSNDAHAGTTLWIDDVELIYLPTSLSNEETEMDVQIFPNPVLDKFEIRFAGEKAQSVEIYDYHGRVITHLSPQERIHSMSGMKPGVYLVRVVSNYGTIWRRVVKQ